MSKGKVIDFRVRPPYERNWDFFKDENGNLTTRYGFDRYGFEYKGSVATEDFDEFLKELDEAGIDKAVIPGRGLRGISNDALIELVEKYPDRFIAFPYVDPLEGQKALDDIDKYVINGKGVGIALEPGFAANETYDIDDERAYPVYEKLEKNNIPLLLTYSSFALDYFDVKSPQRIDKIARKFKNLKIVLGHGGWPWVRESISLALVLPNVYLSPDTYATTGPGAADYIAAAQTVLKDKIVYGSSYPILPLKGNVDFVREHWGLTEETEEKVLYGNAAKLLGLE
jgi:hypothetical protein